jgi:hypothetical protein
MKHRSSYYFVVSSYLPSFPIPPPLPTWVLRIYKQANNEDTSLSDTIKKVTGFLVSHLPGLTERIVPKRVSTQIEVHHKNERRHPLRSRV